MLKRDMTPAQKAHQTRVMNKIWEAHEGRCEQTDQAYYAFAETLYPERNRIIDEAEAERNRIIAEAEAKCEATRDAEMAKFNKAMEVLEAERTTVRHASLEIVKAETAKFVEMQNA